ncbi:caspase family protein [Desulfobacula toluolica]|uniref:WD-40 repeat domain protein n=1 Tax=Desulfobacula toluolica (strain DSM 7467 / Tol2) TaxID=651182 RepID=K0NPD4_DESTT|nr:caspase family protein [Desulfobacula toluolica]CCK80692.1 WD-40 repeat domain protein [Desulfobacula toluolica Tol2]
MRMNTPESPIHNPQFSIIKWISSTIFHYQFSIINYKMSNFLNSQLSIINSQLLIVLLISLLIAAPKAFANAPTSKPMLRLNTNMHSAIVRRISSDAAGRVILTCSDDKTARLWNADDGRLIKTFRVPVGKGHEGKLFACALSSDGRTAAVGGWTRGSDQNSGNHNIYLFNTATGEMIQRIAGMENVINDLEFYSNTIFAAALGRDQGIRIFKRSGPEFTLYKQDTDYGSDSYNLAFDNKGRLASVCFDGYIRLYDTAFNRIKKVKTSGGKQPYSIAFSLDNEKLAVGYNDSGTVEVFSAKNLELLYRPDNKDADTWDKRLFSLTFGQGRYLYGGGSYKKIIDGVWWNCIRRWSKDGKGAFIDFKAAGNLVIDIKPLADKSILVAGTQPDMGRYKPAGEKIFYNRGEVSNFRNRDRFEYFTISHDAGEISFKPLVGKALTFSIKTRELKPSDQRFEHYRDQYKTITITDWKDSYSPKINGKKTNFLDQYEMSRSVDIGDDNTILVGASFFVYALDAAGNQKWRAQVPGEAWNVNIAGNGKTAVAAHDGGQIRWYRMSDGAVLLSLFVHTDGKRWILSTPDGYYDASPGADTLMGWHINNGKDNAPGFYPVSKFASKFYRPDVVENIITYNDLDKALAHADKNRKNKPVNLDIRQMLPPVVSIMSPQNNHEISSNTVQVRYRVQTPSGEAVTHVKVLIDGRPTGQRDIQRKKTKGTAEITITIPSKDCTLSIIAENRFCASDPATVKLRWKGQDEFVIKPKLYVLAMGTSQYDDKDLCLGYPSKDARDIAAVFKNQKGGIYRDVVSKVFSNPTRDDVMDGLDWIEKETTDLDVAAVFLAGHGLNDRNGNYYYLPANANLDRLKRTGVSYSAIKDTIKGLPGKVLFFIDTCHSGNVMGTKASGAKQRGTPADINQIANDLSTAENGIVVFTSSSGKQYSLENDAWQNGAFTKALVEGLSGKADYHKDKKISISELTLYVAERVKELTGGRQTPTTSKPDTISDFPIAVRDN